MHPYSNYINVSKEKKSIGSKDLNSFWFTGRLPVEPNQSYYIKYNNDNTSKDRIQNWE